LCATNLRSGTPQRYGRAQVRSYRGKRRLMGHGLNIVSLLPVGGALRTLRPCRSAPYARPTYRAIHPSAAVAHKVRSYKGTRTLMGHGLDVARLLQVGVNPVR